MEQIQCSMMFIDEEALLSRSVLWFFITDFQVSVWINDLPNQFLLISNALAMTNILTFTF